MFDFEFFLGGFVFHFEFARLSIVFVFCFIEFFFCFVSFNLIKILV